jgi:preprotein translocase SecE subunit
MALAVKNSPETSTAQLLDRLSVSILLGVAYVLGCVGLLIGLSQVWFSVVPDSFPTRVLLPAVIAVAGSGLAFLGLRLLGPNPAHGLKAGIFLAVTGLALGLLLGRLVAGWIEIASYQGFLGLTATIGMILAAIAAAAIAVAIMVWVVRPRTHKWLILIEDQGWFSASFYKRSQGLMVRRLTIAGLLGTVACGIYVMIVDHNVLVGTTNWEMNVPFTGKVVIIDPKDASEFIAKQLPDDYKGTLKVVDKGGSDLTEGAVVSRVEFAAAAEKAKAERKQPPKEQLVLDRFVYHEQVERRFKENYVRVEKAGDEHSPFSDGQIVEKSRYEAARKELKDKGLNESELPKAAPDVIAPEISLAYTAIPLFPYVKLTLPFFVAGLFLWFSWRLVNLPVFADFLIATEAELNKVSWTTRNRLKQDTIVVLITVFLLSVFILTMDTVWYKLLSWSPVGVLQTQKKTDQPNVNEKTIPW